jgi:hypothetical protein
MPDDVLTVRASPARRVRSVPPGARLPTIMKTISNLSRDSPGRVQALVGWPFRTILVVKATSSCVSFYLKSNSLWSTDLWVLAADSFG